MEDDEDSSTLDESIDSWMQDIRDRQLQAEASRKSYFTREDEGNFKDSEIKRNVRLLCQETRARKSIQAASMNIIARIEHLGLDGIEKLVRNGYPDAIYL